MSRSWSYSPHADVTVGVNVGPDDTYDNDQLEPGQLDKLIKTHKMVTVLISPKFNKAEPSFHADDQFDDENMKTMIHFMDGKYHHSFGDSASSEMIQHAFRKWGKNIPNWDEFLTNILTAVYGSMSEQVNRIADLLD